MEILKACDAIADRIEASAFAYLADADFHELRRILGGLLSSLRKAGISRSRHAAE
jgi:hypothetical protein